LATGGIAGVKMALLDFPLSKNAYNLSAFEMCFNGWMFPELCYLRAGTASRLKMFPQIHVKNKTV
jgi:hypothetical protein